MKVEIPDNRDSKLANSALQDEPLATKKISKYFPFSHTKECIHVIVEKPMPTTISDCEQELHDQLTLLQRLLNKSVYGLYI